MKFIGQICVNGHIMEEGLKPFSSIAQQYCETCGDKTVVSCPSCKMVIQLIEPPSRSNKAHKKKSIDDSVPRFCRHCGTAYPWTQNKLETAQELTMQMSGLNDKEKEILKLSLNDLTADTHRTELAAIRVKTFLSKVAPVAGNALKDVLVSVATDAAKKSLGL